MITQPLLVPVGGMHFFTSDFIDAQSRKTSGDVPDLQVVQAKYRFMNALMKLKYRCSIVKSSISILTLRVTNPFRTFEVLLKKFSKTACSTSLGFMSEYATFNKLIQQLCSASISRNAPPTRASNSMARNFNPVIIGVVAYRVALERNLFSTL